MAAKREQLLTPFLYFLYDIRGIVSAIETYQPFDLIVISGLCEQMQLLELLLQFVTVAPSWPACNKNII